MLSALLVWMAAYTAAGTAFAAGRTPASATVFARNALTWLPASLRQIGARDTSSSFWRHPATALALFVGLGLFGMLAFTIPGARSALDDALGGAG